mmetsp:Transcript_37122/g.74319  ORF Transcript_37122/g.74319 Transcript_37122/m.74319 type:complete len:203 (-) Transcript_37122:1308-1916(-)
MLVPSLNLVFGDSKGCLEPAEGVLDFAFLEPAVLVLPQLGVVHPSEEGPDESLQQTFADRWKKIDEVGRQARLGVHAEGEGRRESHVRVLRKVDGGVLGAACEDNSSEETSQCFQRVVVVFHPEHLPSLGGTHFLDEVLQLVISGDLLAVFSVENGKVVPHPVQSCVPDELTVLLVWKLKLDGIHLAIFEAGREAEVALDRL